MQKDKKFSKKKEQCCLILRNKNIIIIIMTPNLKLKFFRTKKKKLNKKLKN
jgi:hypothetical protein